MRFLVLVNLLVCLFLPTNAMADDVHQVTYPDGSKRWSVTLKNGVPHGESTKWHPNGQVASTGQYVDGKKSGQFSFWTDDGQLTRQVVYHNGVIANANSFGFKANQIKKKAPKKIKETPAPVVKRTPTPWEVAAIKRKKENSNIMMVAGLASIAAGFAITYNAEKEGANALTIGEAVGHGFHSIGGIAIGGAGAGLLIGGIMKRRDAKQIEKGWTVDISASQQHVTGKLRLNF